MSAVHLPSQDAKATSIQTGVRAWLARRTVDKARREWQMRTAAALRVQSVWRGCRGRRFAREILHEKIKVSRGRPSRGELTIIPSQLVHFAAVPANTSLPCTD
jgi:hypothetical protein